MLKKRNRGENQKGVSDISPTLQESQNKILTIDWSDFVYWFQLFIIQICTLMDDSTFASRKSSLRAYALLVLTPRYTVWLKPHDQSLYEIHKRSHDPRTAVFQKAFFDFNRGGRSLLYLHIMIISSYTCRLLMSFTSLFPHLLTPLFSLLLHWKGASHQQPHHIFTTSFDTPHTPLSKSDLSVSNWE